MLFKLITGLSLILAVIFFVCMDLAVWALPVTFLASFAALFLLAVLVLWIVCSLVDLKKPQEEDSKFYRAFMHIYIEALIQLVRVRIHTKGLENTPKNKRFLLVCNHLFVADPGIVLHCFKSSQLAFLTKKENYKLPFIGAFMHKILCQPIDRENDRQALKSIIKCIQLIKEDKVSVCAFPEGYTSKDGTVHPFRPGVFKIAQKTNVPIAVCTIQGTRQIFQNLKHLKHTDVEMHLVRVIQPEEYAGMTTVALSEMVYETMISDLGEGFRFQG